MISLQAEAEDNTFTRSIRPQIVTPDQNPALRTRYPISGCEADITVVIRRSPLLFDRGPGTP